MDASTLWWLLALVLGLTELFTGTFFLVMIAVGCVVAGLAAYTGQGMTVQLLAAVAGVLAGAVFLRMRNNAAASALPSDQNPDVMLDIGGRVHIDQWSGPRRTEVRYRGAAWQVELSPGVPDGQPGEYEIRRISGNTLIVQAADV